MDQINTIFYIVILIFSIVVHEVSHGYAALSYGDETARYAGRLTLNPLKHLDPFGSVILPVLLLITHAGFLIGWAKPVPFNENNFRDKKRGTIAVAVAGIAANLAIAIFFGLVIRACVYFGYGASPLLVIASIIVLVNLLLAVFNLIPIPPLDGSRILTALLPARIEMQVRSYEKYGMFLLLFFVLFGWQFVSPIIFKTYALLTGFALPV